jgi:hypothetical protein
MSIDEAHGNPRSRLHPSSVLPSNLPLAANMFSFVITSCACLTSKHGYGNDNMFCFVITMRLVSRLQHGHVHASQPLLKQSVKWRTKTYQRHGQLSCHGRRWSG